MAATTAQSTGTDHRLVTADDVDRAREFRRAYRHSRVIRMLRWITPLVAVALFLSYGLAMRVALTDTRGGTLTAQVEKITAENLTMNNPEYQGFNKDGSKFLVRARTAAQDLRLKNGPITLRDIDARLLGVDNVPTRVTSPRGIYQSETSVLELFERVDVRSGSGLTATMTRATVHTKDGTVTSPEPVLVEMATGWVHGNQMAMNQRTKQAAFTGGVTAQLTPTPEDQIGKRAVAVGGLPVKPLPSPAAAGPRVLSASRAPVDVSSERLDIDDEKKRAVFNGAVTAIQGEATLQASVLEIEYAGDAAQAPGAPPAKPKQSVGEATSAQQGQVKTITARENVLLTRGIETAQAPLGVFSAETETAALTGGVLLRQGNDRQATADRADIDTRTQSSKLTGNVVLTSGATQRASADALELDQKGDTALLTGQQVVVTQGPNTLSGRRLLVNRKAGSTEMTAPGGRISAHLVREPPSLAGPAKAKAEPQGPTVGGLTLKGDPNSPIDVEAERMLALDTQKTATFSGDVVARQGDFKLKTPELVATYSGEMSMLRDPAAPTAAPPKTKAAKDPSATGAELTRIRANRKVVLTTSDDREVIGDWADFDIKTNQITIGVDLPDTTNVVVRQGGSNLYGPKLIVDMTTGAARWEARPRSATASGVPPAPIVPLAPPAEIPVPGTATQAVTQKAIQAIRSQNCGGRPCAVFDVKALRERAAEGAKGPKAAEIEAKAQVAIDAASKALDSRTPDLKALVQSRSATGWSATTAPPPKPAGN